MTRNTSETAGPIETAVEILIFCRRRPYAVTPLPSPARARVLALPPVLPAETGPPLARAAFALPGWSPHPFCRETHSAVD